MAGALARAVGGRDAAAADRRLRQAAEAYATDRHREAATLLRPLARQAPDVAPVRELAGLALYRLGQWREAIAHLEAFRALTGSLDQHPVLADCHRALGHHAVVTELWEELGQASPRPELVAEGRIVAAGALADQGRLPAAIVLLERAPQPRGRPRTHHLRTWYALADLYERSGDTPRARSLFRAVATAAPELADVAARAEALG